MRRHLGATILAAAISLWAFAGHASVSDAEGPAKAKSSDADLPKKAKPTVLGAPAIFFINDNRLTYAYLPRGRQNTIIGPIEKQIFAFSHFDAWAYGTNSFSVLLAKSAKNDPAGPCPFSAQGCAGETYIRGSLRSTFGFNEVFNTKTFTWGILRNVSFEVGVDADTTNAYIGASTRDLVAGVQFSFDLPYKGFVNVAPLYYQEWNHNSFLTPNFIAAGYTGIPDGNTRYRGTWALEANYYMDLGFLPENLRYFAISGRVGVYGPKGDGSYGPYTLPPTSKSTTEIISEPIRLTFDVSKAIWGAQYSHIIDYWVSYLVRLNRNGNDDSNRANRTCFTASGTNNGSCSERSVYTGVTLKF